MAQSILVPLIPTLTFVFSALLMLYLYRGRLLQCFSRSKTAVYTEIPSDIESASIPAMENPACVDPPPTPTTQNTHASWIDSLVEYAVHQVWTGLDLDSLFEPAPPVPHGIAINGDSDKRCGSPERACTSA
ncbi:predicted protein [Aspergillus terreus NIH2624]|uniref:Uncharacterized protein n=1 Tax=Aspergillus terreus (strain NIH 2624 / FGSC A1156) TaxID=341663 RepID=Q0CIH4_ASPTN|nr:uncharacterized protein ATEG_06510 [Aspergillus terreus NIH2624]EAU33054.1 predicted protein [Aspergillus terreus NIH2624]